MKTNRIVCRKLSALFIVLLGLFLCNACSKDTPNLGNVRVQVEANSDEPVRIYGTKDGGETGVVIKRNYDSTFKLDGDGFTIEARCNDDKTLIKINVWVNGKLKKNVSGNKFVTSGYISLRHRR